jgi:heterodisulfide reductase subunit A
MLVHGLKGQRIYNQARHMGVRFFRVGGPDQMTWITGDGGISLEINEATLPGVSVTLDTDLMVIPAAVSPASSSGPISRFLRQNLDEEGFMQSANVRHRPVGSPRQGVFFIGSCHDETDDGDLQQEINAVKVLLHQMTSGRLPLEPAAAIDEGKCGRCLTCYRACPHAAVIIRNNIQPMIVAEACLGCGICVSSCPAKAISADPGAQIPAAGPIEGATVVFACQRSGALAAKAAGISSKDTKLIEVRCAGQLDEQTLLQPLLEGAARVIVAACHEGNCRSMIGSRSAATRTAKMIDQLGLDHADVRHHAIAANEPARMARIVADGGSGKENAHA